MVKAGNFIDDFMEIVMNQLGNESNIHNPMCGRDSSENEG